eukprot:1157785-Pelagomonas_calceolata.AAC.4
MGNAAACLPILMQGKDRHKKGMDKTAASIGSLNSSQRICILLKQGFNKKAKLLGEAADIVIKKMPCGLGKLDCTLCKSHALTSHPFPMSLITHACVLMELSGLDPPSQ